MASVFDAFIIVLPGLLPLPQLFRMYKKIIQLYLKIKSALTGYGFFGSYESFDHALKTSGGYDNEAVFDKVIAASRLARDGKVAYERDGLTFDEPKYSTELLSAILFAKAEKQHELNVLDFGGALGSHYFQHKWWFEGTDIKWNIVEQKQFVQIGQQEFESENLKFYNSIEEVIDSQKPDFALMGCVLPYLPEPYNYLEQICNSGAKYLFIDKHPVINSANDRLTIQKVPPTIYEAAYPAWFFAEQKFLNFMSKYELLATFDCPDIFNIACEYKSYFYRLKKS